MHVISFVKMEVKLKTFPQSVFLYENLSLPPPPTIEHNPGVRFWPQTQSVQHCSKSVATKQHVRSQD